MHHFLKFILEGNYIFRTVPVSVIRKMHQFLKFILEGNYIFRRVPVSVIRKMHQFLKFILEGNYIFRTVPLSVIRSFSLCTQQWFTCMSYRFADSFRAGSGWNILILLASCQQTYMTYTIAVCTVKNSWWWTEELPETCGVTFQNKFENLVHLVGLL